MKYFIMTITAVATLGLSPMASSPAESSAIISIYIPSIHKKTCADWRDIDKEKCQKSYGNSSGNKQEDKLQRCLKKADKDYANCRFEEEAEFAPE